MFTPPAEVEAVLATFASLFTRPSWRRAQALLCGTLLAPANHALTAALRALGLAGDAHFQNYHRLLNRARWSAHQAARLLLVLLIRAFAPVGPVILGLDETVERRRGLQIEARAIYRDAARSSRECFQKTSGLRWLSLHLLVPVRWAKRVWALPFLTALCPSARYAAYTRKGRRHKPLIERARGLIGQARRWLPDRALILVADSGYAALELLAWGAKLRQPVTMITRLRLDAALYEPAPARQPKQTGRPAIKGKRLPTLARELQGAQLCWQRCRLAWYGGKERILSLATGTAVWYHSGKPPVTIRWVLIRDPRGRFEPQALLSTEVSLEARQIVGFFVRRWTMETSFQEAKAHLGIEGQRQWNNLAVARATPLRLALFSLVTLIVDKQPGWQASVRQAAWYKKTLPTFSDALAQVRRCLWQRMAFCMSHDQNDSRKPPADLFAHFGEVLAYAA
jgi:hypothetical protein